MKTLTILVACALGAATARAEWTSLNIASNLTVNAFYTNGGIFYACTSSGVFSTTDRGTTWWPRNRGLTWGNGVVPSVLALAAAGDTMLAGTDGHGVYMSTNRGVSWQACAGGLAGGIAAIAVRGTTWLAGAPTGLYSSSDKGASWQATSVRTSVAAIKDAGAEIVIAGRSGVMTSADDGDGWDEAREGLADTVIRAFAMSGDTAVAITSHAGVYRSVDGCATWTAGNAGLSLVDLNADGVAIAIVGNAVYLGCAGGVFVSTDGGSSWKSTASPLPTATALFKGYKAVGFDRGTLFAGATGDNEFVSATHSLGVYRSSDGGASWSSANAGLSYGALYLFAGAAHGETVFAGTGSTSIFDARSAIYASSDDGATWTGRDGDQIAAHAMFQNDDSLLAGVQTYSADKSGLVVSTDGGATWRMRTDSAWRVTFSTAFDSKNGITAFTMSQGTVYAGILTGGVYRSDDLGVNWTAAVAPPPDPVVALTIVDAGLFAATARGAFLSTDGGAHWLRDTAGMGALPVNSFATLGTMVFAAAGRASTGGAGGGVFMRSEGTWIPAGQGIPDSVGVNDILAVHGVLFAATDNGLMMSNDSGATWREVRHRSIDDPIVTSLAATDAYLYVASRTGVFRTPLAELTAVEQAPAAQAPGVVTLGANYPQPFRGSTTIPFSIARTRRIAIRVYDMLGRCVSVVADGMWSAGNHAITLSSASLPAGIYRCELTAGNSRDVRMMTVVR